MSDKIKNAIYALNVETVRQLRQLYNGSSQTNISQILTEESRTLANLTIEMRLKAETALKKALKEEGVQYVNNVWLDIGPSLPTPAFSHLDWGAIRDLENSYKSSSFTPYEARYLGGKDDLAPLDYVPLTVIVLCVVGMLAVIAIPGISIKFVVPLALIGAAVGVVCKENLKRVGKNILNKLFSPILPSSQSAPEPLNYSSLITKTLAANEKAAADWYKTLDSLSQAALSKALKQ